MHSRSTHPIRLRAHTPLAQPIYRACYSKTTICWHGSATETIDKLGYSIFLYDVPPRGTATDLILGNVQVGELTLNDYTNFGTNDIPATTGSIGRKVC